MKFGQQVHGILLRVRCHNIRIITCENNGRLLFNEFNSIFIIVLKDFQVRRCEGDGYGEVCPNLEKGIKGIALRQLKCEEIKITRGKKPFHHCMRL